MENNSAKSETTSSYSKYPVNQGGLKRISWVPSHVLHDAKD